MKKLLLSLILLAGTAHAVTNGPVAISSGTAFYNVDTSSMPNAQVRQNIVIGDPNLTSGLAPVSSITGLTVNLATSTAIVGQVILQQPSVVGATVTYNGTQQVNVGTLYQPSVLGATVTYNGTQTVNVATGGVTAVLGTGANVIGSISNTGFTVSTGGVTSAQGPPGTQDWRVTMSTNAVTGTVAISTGGVTAAQGGTWTVNVATGGVSVKFDGTQTVNVATGGVTSAQGPPATLDWPVRVSTVTVFQSTVTIMAPNNNTTAIPVSGSFSASSVDITTAAPNGAMPIALQIMGGVNASGFAQTFAVDSSSRVQIAGSISATAIDLTTNTYNATLPGYGGSVVYIGPTGLTQSPMVNVSSWTMVSISTAVTLTVSAHAVTVSTGGVSASAMVNSPSGVPTAVGWSSTISSVPVSIQGTPTVSASQSGIWSTNQGGTLWGATVTFNGSQNVLFPNGQPVVSTSTYIVNPTTASLYITNNAGTGLTGVGYQTSGGSVPVNLVSTAVVQGFSPVGTTITGNPLPQGLFVTSTTIPTTRSDTQAAYWSGTNIGQGLVTGVPFGLQLSTYSATVASTAASGYGILVSSPATGLYTYLCGCIFTNTTATNNKILLKSPASTTSNVIAIGAPASFVPSGLFPGCMNPFYRSGSASEISIQETVTVAASAAIEMRCNYYQGP